MEWKTQPICQGQPPHLRRRQKKKRRKQQRARRHLNKKIYSSAPKDGNWRRSVVFNLWHAHGSQWKLLQMRELRGHERVLLIGQEGHACVNQEHKRANNSNP